MVHKQVSPVIWSLELAGGVVIGSSCVDPGPVIGHVHVVCHVDDGREAGGEGDSNYTSGRRGRCLGCLHIFENENNV